MKKLILALAFLCTPALNAQTITQQPTSQSVTVGQTATFSVTVSGGPCRSFFNFRGVGAVSHYGPFLSTDSYSLPNVTLAMNGWTVQVQLYGCAGGPLTLNSNTVTLTVTPPITLQSIVIITPSPLIGIGQTDLLTVMGNYSDGSTQNLTSTAAWTSDTPAVASVSGGTVLGVSAGITNINAAVGGFTAITGITVEPILNVTFLPSNEDGTPPPASLVVSQIVTNPDGTMTATPVLQLPDPGGATSLPLLYSPTLLYQAAFFLNQVPVGQAVVFSPTLMTLVMPKIQSMSFSVVLCVTSCPVGAVKNMSWSAQ